MTDEIRPLVGGGLFCFKCGNRTPNGFKEFKSVAKATTGYIFYAQCSCGLEYYSSPDIPDKPSGTPPINLPNPVTDPMGFSDTIKRKIVKSVVGIDPGNGSNAPGFTTVYRLDDGTDIVMSDVKFGDTVAAQWRNDNSWWNETYIDFKPDRSAIMSNEPRITVQGDVSDALNILNGMMPMEISQTKKRETKKEESYLVDDFGELEL